MPAPIVLIGAFDTKGSEYAFLRDAILAQGGEMLAVNVGVMGSTTLFPVDIEADRVARAAGEDLAALRASADRGAAMKTMAAGAAVVVRQLYEQGKLAGI